VLTVAGRIEGETLAELKRVIGLETRDRELVLDLVDVTLIDQAAILYLAQCSQDWPVLCNCPAYIRKWIVAEKERHPATTD
jgi:anti-anti-sigma regulatory factor